jgi:hypothetical protein
MDGGGVRMADVETEIAKLILAMSEDDFGAFAAGICDHLEGYYFVRDGSHENLDEDHVQKAQRAWAEDELRTGGSS